jgi:hypothetical protein
MGAMPSLPRRSTITIWNSMYHSLVIIILWPSLLVCLQPGRWKCHEVRVFFLSFLSFFLSCW